MIREKIDEKIALALKAGNHDELDVWRSIKTVFTNYKTAKAHNEITDQVEIELLKKMACERKDSIEQYTNGGRTDLAEKEQKELDILSSLLPKEPTEDEIENAVGTAIVSLKLENGQDYFITMKDMKYVMNFVKSKYPMANGSIISKIVKDFI